MTGGRGGGDDTIEDLVHVEASLGGDADDVGRGAAEETDDFGGDLLDIGGREVDFVDDGDDIEVLLEGEVDVGEGLGLDALSGVDDEDGGLDGLERAGDFVRKIDVARSVDEVELVALVVHLNRGEFDGDSLFALELHGVEEPGFHLAFFDGVGEFHHAVGKGGFAVVDVGDDAEIPDFVDIHYSNYNIKIDEMVDEKSGFDA